MTTKHTPGPWEVFEKKLTDGSCVYDLHYRLYGARFAGEVVINAFSEAAAFEARDAMNAAIAKAEGR